MTSQEALGIIGSSPLIRDLVATVRQIAPTDISVLLLGESGTGKEVFARAIHTLSTRSAHPMIAINCGAIPQTLLESELFGHEKGAFTGAVETRKGLFEAAEGGTVFLDEIGDMPLSTQVRLLRVLESFEYSRVGSTQTRRTNVRVVAATNRDLPQAIAKGEFRQDLFYRLRSVQLTIPSLRERPEDIPALLEHFAQTTCQRLGVVYAGADSEAIDMLCSYPWHGNVRELRNFTELAVTLERGGRITARVVREHLQPEQRYVSPEQNPGAIVHLPGRTSEQVERELIYRALLELRNEVADLKGMIADATRHAPPVVENYPALPAPKPSIAEVLRDSGAFNLAAIEKQAITAALIRYHGNRRLAARALGLSERTLYRKITDYDLENVGTQEDL